MSRSGYSDDCENVELWRTAVRNAIYGKRGQALLRDLAAALDAMPEKRLITNELKSADGEFCTLGVLGAARGVNMAPIDPEDRYQVADVFNIAPAMAAEIVYENDENARRYDSELKKWIHETSEERWTRMRKWVESNLTKDSK